MNNLNEIIKVIEGWSEQIARWEEMDEEGSRLLLNQEEAAYQLGRRVAQMALEGLISKGGKGYRGVYLPCECGKGRQRYQRDQRRAVRTLVGEVSYDRSYYYCRECGKGSCPKDEDLGQSRREISAGVERSLGLLSAHLSFATAAKLLQEVGRVSLSSREAETVSEALGKKAEEAEQAAVDQAQDQDLCPAVLPSSRKKAERVWVVEMDGVMVGLQDGSWQEVKCGLIYELGQRVEISPGRWELLQRQRCAVRGNVEQFRGRLWSLLLRAGVKTGDRIVVIADGAEWIDQTVEHLFVGATRIFDFYHTAQRIWTVAGVRYGEGSDKARIWAQRKLRSLKDGEIKSVCRAIKQLKLESEDEQIRRDSLRYLENHQQAMAYDSYAADGLPIGSGAIEGSCKYLVTARCKQAGMRWTEPGVDAIVALRCWVLNDRLDELCPKPKVKIDLAKAA